MSNLNGKIVGKGYTYDQNVPVYPAFSEILPSQVDLKTHLTRNITINVPIVSAAMDTVTDSTLAIAIARVGGLGFIHKNMSIEQQAGEVRRVKRSESGKMIKDPITLPKDARISEALEIMRYNKIGGIPIVDGEETLAGILTNRDLRFEKDKTRRVSEVMTRNNLITAREGVNLREAEDILQEHKIEKLPVVSKKVSLSGSSPSKTSRKSRTTHTPVKMNSGGYA